MSEIDVDAGQRRRTSHDRGVLSVTGAADHPCSVRGLVVRGDQRGCQLGFPTANVPIDQLIQAVPPDGVYAGWLRRLDTDEVHPAAISVGTNPTFGELLTRRVESHVVDRIDLELYEVEVEVGFVERLRGMMAFESVENLTSQMGADVVRAREVLGVRAKPQHPSTCITTGLIAPSREEFARVQPEKVDHHE